MGIRKHGRRNVMSRFKPFLIFGILILFFCLVIFYASRNIDKEYDPILNFCLIWFVVGVGFFVLWIILGLSNEDFHPIPFPYYVMCLAGALFGRLNPLSILVSIPVAGFGLWLGWQIINASHHLAIIELPTKNETILIFCGEFALAALVFGFILHCHIPIIG